MAKLHMDMARKERRELWKAKWVIYRVGAGNRGNRRREWRLAWKTS